jgi:putative ABC transport system permease protein
MLLGLFAAIALGLSVIGVYAVMAFAVVQRTREIGIRMALGAQRREALRLVLWQGLRLSAIGIVAGGAGALAATRLLGKMLYGVSPRDPVTLVSVAALMVAVALAASYIPARRATRVEPMVALRYE